MRLRPTRWLLASLLAVTPGCGRETGTLTPAQEQRFAAEGLLHRADNLTFRWTQGAGRRGGTWEDRVASIVVTRRSVLVHKNEKVGIEIGPDSRASYEVHRDGQRVRISAGSGAAAESWSFSPPDNAEVWTQDIRSVIRASGSASP
jgi:hypothetical protein